MGGASIDAMLYVKHLTHAHFVRSRTDTYNITSVDAGASLGASLHELASEAAAVCVHS